MTTKTEAIKINEKNIINFASSVGVSTATYSSIMKAVDVKIKQLLSHTTHKFLAYVRLMILLFFGTRDDLWDFVLHHVLNIPEGPYIRGLTQPVLHCPVCGSPGRPNGSTKYGAHEYICPHHHTHFTEKTSAEYKVFRYILLLKALQLLKSGVSVRLISLILGIPRAELSTAFRKLDLSRIAENMRNAVVAAVRSILERKKYALIVIDTTFVGNAAVILLTVENQAVSMYIAEAEKAEYITLAASFLKKHLSEEELKRLVFLSDGSPQIFKALSSLFPSSVYIRQIHSEKHRGLVLTHFEYSGNRYTLITRWDHLVPEDERMTRVRGQLEGEKLLQEDEIIIYTGDLVKPPVELDEKSIEQRIGECVRSAEFISHLDTEMKADYERYKNYGRGRFPSRVRYMLNTFRKTKRYLRDSEVMCRAVNTLVLSGFEKLLQQNLSEYSARYLSHIYTAFRQVGLCKGAEESSKKRFKEIKTKIMEIFRKKLVEAGLLQVADNEEKRTPRDGRSKRLFRGMPDELDGETRKIYERGIEILSTFFAGKYITSNMIEGYFGRVKTLVKQHRSGINYPKYIYAAFWRSFSGSTNRMRMISELIDDYPLNLIFEAEANSWDTGSNEYPTVGAMISMRKHYHGKTLGEGRRYEIRYKNRQGETKCHDIEVLKILRRRNVMKRTWYIVRYIDTNEVRTLRGDRIIKAKEIK